MSRANPRFRRNNVALSVPINNVYRLRVVGSIEGQMTVNTFFYRDNDPTGSATGASLSKCGAAFLTVGGMNSLYLACLSSDWSYTGIYVDCPTQASLATIFSPQAGNGTGPAGHEPTEVAAVLLKATGIKGQCGRGRMGLPAVPTSWVTASKVTTRAAYDALSLAASGTITALGAVFTPVLFSRNGSRFMPGKQGMTDIESVFLTPLLGTVRRRKIGRGK